MVAIGRLWSLFTEVTLKYLYHLWWYSDVCKNVQKTSKKLIFVLFKATAYIWRAFKCCHITYYMTTFKGSSLHHCTSIAPSIEKWRNGWWVSVFVYKFHCFFVIFTHFIKFDQLLLSRYFVPIWNNPCMKKRTLKKTWWFLTQFPCVSNGLCTYMRQGTKRFCHYRWYTRENLKFYQKNWRIV